MFELLSVGILELLNDFLAVKPYHFSEIHGGLF